MKNERFPAFKIGYRYQSRRSSKSQLALRYFNLPITKRVGVLASCLFLGISIPLLVFVPLSVSNKSYAVEEINSSKIKFEIGAPILTRTSLESDNSDTKLVIGGEKLSFSLHEFIQQQQIMIKKRKFLYYDSLMRKNEPEFIKNIGLEDFQAVPIRTSDLTLKSSTQGRYSYKNNKLEYQGDFSLIDATKNYKLGQEYKDYLDGHADSQFHSKLTSVSNSRSELLSKLAKYNKAEPTLRNLR